MARIVSGCTITTAWLAALECLSQHDDGVFNLVVEINDPAPRSAHGSVLSELDRLLEGKRLQSVATVANTIFPNALACSSRDRHQLYARYQKLVPHLRKLRKNRKGLYFERLIEYPLGAAEPNLISSNQLETVIQDLRKQRAGPTPLRFAYELQIFAPGKDRLPRGFPCMSSLSFQLDGEQLRLTATYRNQYYIERALGNFLGLAHLQHFVANETRLHQGPLTVHAFHAEIERKVGKRDAAKLIQACQRHVMPP